MAVRSVRSDRQQAVGLRHIAEELNVSVSLVSKVLSGRLGTSGVQESRVQAIRAKAHEMGYQKNLLAEALRTGRQNVLALFLHRHGEPGSGIVDEMIGGVADEAAKQQQRLVIHFYESSEEFRAFLPRMHRNTVDGMVVGGLPHNDLVDDLKTIHARGIPIVSIHDQELDPAIPNVGMNQFEVSRQATLHLIDRGCRRLAHLCVSEVRTSLPRDRSRGFFAALAERGLPRIEKLIVHIDTFSHGEALKAMQRLADSGEKFDGVVGQSDQHGLAAINFLVSHGVRVPQDVKVIGIDNAPLCNYGIVPLSSVSQEFGVRGQLATQLLLDTLGGKKIESMFVDPIVSARASSL